jgi:4-hydroxybenzoate polyprenyltransferase
LFSCNPKEVITAVKSYLPLSMRTFIKKLIDLFLYGNFWIAGCAIAMGWQTQYLLSNEIHWDTMMAFLFWSTLFLYAVHRIVGIQKLRQYKEVERYGVIVRFRHHIRVYAAVGLLGTLWSLWHLPWSVWLWLLVPGTLAMGYVIPILGSENKRLRDLNFIKIFLVALVWTWMTVVLPQVYYEYPLDSSIALMVLERCFFIFAITLPFDIRDMKVDRESDVKTIPTVIGVQKSKYLSLICLLMMITLAGINYQIGFYDLSTWIALCISAAITFMLIHRSNEQSHDYYISGIIDGTMILQAMLVILL